MKKLILFTIVTILGAFQAEAKTTHVAFLIYDNMNILDFTGPREVIGQANNALRIAGSKDSINAYTIGYLSKTVKAFEGTVVVADYLLKDAPTPDIIIIPGGKSDQIANDLNILKWVKNNIASSPDSKIVMSVCTGSWVIANAGLLDGKEATTHQAAIADFQKEFPKIKVRSDMRFVDQGNVITTAGVSAGIDGALHLVIRLYGKAIAEKAVYIMEYEWNPKYQY